VSCSICNRRLSVVTVAKLSQIRCSTAATAGQITCPNISSTLFFFENLPKIYSTLFLDFFAVFEQQQDKLPGNLCGKYRLLPTLLHKLCIELCFQTKQSLPAVWSDDQISEKSVL